MVTEDGGRKCNQILLLHGDRQTGGLLMGRLERLQKRLMAELQMTLIAPDAPFSVATEDDASVHLTWWTRQGNDYQGLEATLDMLKLPPWNSEHVVGIIGFSQGARLAHLLTRLRQDEFNRSKSFSWFPNLKFVMIVAGYDAPVGQSHCFASHTGLLNIPSLHVWGLADALIPPAKSESLTKQYEKPVTHVHPGTHFVPTKRPDIQIYIDFISGATALHDRTIPQMQQLEYTSKFISFVPDEETATMQLDEVQALMAIFPDEIHIKSPHHYIGDELAMNFPITYNLKLLPEGGDNCHTKWPVHPLTLEIFYPCNYPLEATPQYRLIHTNNNMQYSSSYVDKVLKILETTSQLELGIPSVLSGIYAVKEYLDAPPVAERVRETEILSPTDLGGTACSLELSREGEATHAPNSDLFIRVSSPERIQLCNLEGLEIADRVLKTWTSATGTNTASSFNWGNTSGNGGSFGQYTIGLVGKPSAGKSTFFNAATAFSRQRNTGGDVTVGGKNDSDWGGASMAAHPFTTIDPNIGYCLVPAPSGLCPEDTTETPAEFGSTHGRSPSGQRFLPVLLKDVAGLVPGAYLGRGRGNQFLNDLTDATVLIHVVDASGTADAQGNKVVVGDDTSELTNPLDDLAWIRNELVEWVYSNLARKWTTIVRKGRDRIPKMFSGYGQRDMETKNILAVLEEFLAHRYKQIRSLDHLGDWDQGDIHRLVSAFLGVRFPMALALNKCDLRSSQVYVRLIQENLPIHGAHAGTPMAAENEMKFVRNHLRNKENQFHNKLEPFHGHVWNCLTTALSLREPVLVFPVSDMTTYASLPGLHKRAIESASLPSPGMIRCIKASGGTLPSCWDEDQQAYVIPRKDKSSRAQLRDVMIMKAGSTVEDVFLSLKKVGALSGEFVRAEAAGEIGEQAKPVSKSTPIGKQNRIIKIMSNRRTAWQS